MKDHILVTGASGQLGLYLIDRLLRCGMKPVAWSGSKAGAYHGVPFHQINLNQPEQIQEALNQQKPEVIIHAGAMSGADDVRRNPELGRKINTEATRVIADWASNCRARLIFTSTDLVFNGTKSFWKETDQPDPLLAYGRTKHDAEPYVTELANGLVARISLLYGPTLTGRPSFYTSTLDALRQGQRRGLFTDEWRTPLTYEYAANVLSRLATDLSDVNGILHVGGPERLTRFQLIQRAAVEQGIDPSLIDAVQACLTPMPEKRPLDVSLDTSRLRSLLSETT